MALFPPQQEILDCGLLTAGFSCVLQMPTGSGKTWLAEHAIADALERGRRAIYLTPLRALASELAGRWSGRFASARVGVFTGDYGALGRPYPVPFDDARLLVMTPERLDACTRHWREHWSWLPEVDLLVVDELHLLGDRGRGARLEGAISRLRRLNPFAHILGLSATLGNRRELADWLDGVEYSSDWRPIPLAWRIVRYRRADEKPELLADIVGSAARGGGRSLVFVQSRRRAEALAQRLREAGLRADHHHAGLGRAERAAAEGRLRAGDVDAVVATGTLEMGLNLPVRQVVLYDTQAFDGADYRPLPTSSVWQRVGRAGRPGLDAQGEAVLLVPAWDADARRYLDGAFEPVRSGLADERALAEQILVEAASGLARTRAQLEGALALSLAARQRCLPSVGRAVKTMVQAGMLEEQPWDEGDGRAWRLRPTRLGRVAVRHMLAPATVLLLRRALGSRDDLTFFDMLLAAAASDDCEPLIPVDFEELDELADELGREPSRLLALGRGELEGLLGVGGRRLLAALKTALVVRAWTRAGDAARVAERHGCYPFEVERLREALQRLALAMEAVLEPADAAAPAEPGDDGWVPARERVRALGRMLASGLDDAAATLTLAPGVGPVLARRLRDAGFAHIEDLALADPAELARLPGIGRQRACQLVEASAELVRSRSALRYAERGGGAQIAPAGWPAGVDPYRLRRALELEVRGGDGGMYEVRGGSEPRQVRYIDVQPCCTCPDAARSPRCKHALAVLLARGDRATRELADRLGQASTGEQLSLFDLWFDRRGYAAGRETR